MILIQHPASGEQCLVDSTEGYDGWTVLAEDVPPSPGDHYRWVEHERRWRADPAQRLRAENLAGIRDPEVVLAIFEDLMARIAALEARLP
jgi:hypothetical protein